MWDLTSLTRDQTYMPCTGNGKVLTTEPPGSSYTLNFIHFHFNLTGHPVFYLEFYIETAYLNEYTNDTHC